MDRGCAMGRIEQMIRHAVWNSGAKGIVVGVSGGVDSAVAAAMCCRAISGEQVVGLTLPSAVTPAADIEDAHTLCTRLGMEHRVISIEPVLAAYRDMPGYAENRYLLGNLMARTRMAILYLHANKEGRLVCGTSNKSEYLLGYCTKYGDNAADFQPIVHLLKREVYEMARELDIPAPILEKPPSAGLWEGQSDEGEIGITYAEIDTALSALESQGWNPKTPIEENVLALVKKSEHKRLPALNLAGVL